MGYLVRRNLSLRSASSIIMEAKVSSFDQIAASKRDFESFAGIKAFVSDLEGFMASKSSDSQALLSKR